MMKRWISAWMLGSFAMCAQAGLTLDQLMSELAQHPGGQARFVEKRHLALLDKPVVASGEMTYSAPDRLEKRTLAPKAETLLLDKETLTVERDRRKLSINLNQRPEALAFVESIRGTLAGDRAALERSYRLQLSGTADTWTLTLVPSDARIASMLQRVTISGSQRQVRHIEYQQADGDRTELTIEPLGQP
ncbi:outer membrane lipoprotein carrier protein LolA [Hydrogenophaga aquatica]